MADRLPRHPLPWRPSGPLGRWMRVRGEDPTDRDAVSLSIGVDGDGVQARLPLAALLELRDLCDRLIAAPYRLYVVGGDAVPQGHGFGEVIDDWLGQVYTTVGVLELVGTGGCFAQTAVEVWATRLNVTYHRLEQLDFTAGGNACAVLPAHGRAALDAATAARAAGLAVERPRALWDGVFGRD